MSELRLPGLVVHDAQPPARVALQRLRRMTVYANGPILDGDAGNARVVVDVDGDGVVRCFGPGGKQALDAAALLSTPVRIVPIHELVVEPAVRRGFVTCNCFEAYGGHSFAWRGFAVDDAARALVDVRILSARAGCAVDADAAGAALRHVIATTRAQEATLDIALVRAVLAPLLSLARASRGVDDVIIGWDGVARAPARFPGTPLTIGDAYDAAAELLGVAPDDDAGRHVAWREVQNGKRAAAADVAAWLRALFPDAWRLEQAFREQAVHIDVDALPVVDHP